MVIPQSSLVRMFVPVHGPAGVDLTAFPVELALVPEGAEPTDGDYHAASWVVPEAGDAPEPSLVIGSPTGVPYLASNYMAWARLTAADERPVLKAGRVRIGDVGT